MVDRDLFTDRVDVEAGLLGPMLDEAMLEADCTAVGGYVLLSWPVLLVDRLVVEEEVEVASCDG